MKEMERGESDRIQFSFKPRELAGEGPGFREIYM